MDSSGLITLLLIGGVALLIFTFVYCLMKYLSSPDVRREAVIVAKRTEVSGGRQTSTSTSYYCTFELTGGERVEYSVSGKEFGLLVEGDRGMLVTRADWYQGFERRRG